MPQLLRVFGLHGTGKSEYLYGLLKKCIDERKQAFLIVPEQQAVSAERMLIDRLGNPANMYIEVINFKRLCNRVFRESGGVAAHPLEKNAGQLVMSHVLSELTDNLAEYASLASDVELGQKMLDTVAEMHRCRVTPEALEAVTDEVRSRGAENLAGKIHDIALAYRAYEAYTEQNLEFPGDLLDKLYDTLCTFPFFKGKTVFIDSFYGFTAQELAIIAKILPDAENVCISFVCTDEKQDDPCFARGTRAAAALRKSADKCGVPVRDVYLTENVKHTDAPALRTVAEQFSLTALAADSDSPARHGVEILPCADIYAEARHAVRIVSDLLVQGAKPREIAVCARDTAAYDGILDAEFEAAGIPFSFDSHTDLSATPVAALISAAFDVYFSWSLSAVASYLKTGLSGLEDADADRLELYLRTWNIRGKAYFHEEWQMNPEGLRETPPDAAELRRINRARDLVISCLDGFADALDHAETAADIARAAYGLTQDIARLGGKERFDDHADGVYADLLYRVLDSFHDTVGGERMTPRRFAELYRAMIKNTSVGKIPELIDQVRFSPVTLMRTDGVNYVILLGANDGIFPQKPDSGDIFRDRERRMLNDLGVQLADLDEDKAYDELFLAYTALCSASRGAYVLYRTETLAGEAMYPSVLINILQKLLGITNEELKQRERELKAAPLSQTVSEEALFEAFLTLPDGAEKESARACLAENPLYRARLDSVFRTESTSEPLSAENLGTLYGEEMNSSYSKLERYRECPFAYFCNYTLRLSPPPEGKIGAAENGNIIHKALEELAPLLCERAAAGTLPAPEELAALVREKLAELCKRLLPSDSQALTGRFAHTFARIERALVPLCQTLAEELTVSRFVPTDFELELSEKSEVKPVELPLADGKTLCVVGKIDRVDLFRDPRTGLCWVRIIDYKTGATKFNLEDVRDGFNLQMLLYLYTLIQNGSRRYGDIRPAGVIYTHAVPPGSGSKGAGLAETASPDFKEPQFALDTDGITVRDFDVVFAMDPTGSGKYVPVKLKGGTLAEDAKNTLSVEEFDALLRESAAFAVTFAEGIASGNKCAEPSSPKGKDVCEYCDFKDICPR